MCVREYCVCGDAYASIFAYLNTISHTEVPFYVKCFSYIGRAVIEEFFYISSILYVCSTNGHIYCIFVMCLYV